MAITMVKLVDRPGELRVLVEPGEGDTAAEVFAGMWSAAMEHRQLLAVSVRQVEGTVRELWLNPDRVESVRSS